MTFCLGITVDQGLVGIADTRVVAGNECLVARKTATYQGPGFAFFVMHSGLRSARDKILLYFEDAFARETMTRDRLFKVVNLYAQQVRRVSEEDGEALRSAELKFNAYSLIGGQMSGDSAHKLYLVYPEGNWVEIGPDTPYQIIGASGFGKPILERSLNPHAIPCSTPSRSASWPSTPPASAPPTSISPWTCCSTPAAASKSSSSATERDDLREISDWWQERMREAVQDLPSEWIEAAFPACASR